jgi:hypothetical protein
MMHMMHMTRRKSLQSRALDGASWTLKMGGSVSHFASGPPPHPPRARVTATANIFQREILAFAVRFAGVSHFTRGGS